MQCGNLLMPQFMRTIVGNCLIDLRVCTLMRLGVLRRDGSNFVIIWLPLLLRLWSSSSARLSEQKLLAAKRQAWNQVLCDDSPTSRQRFRQCERIIKHAVCDAKEV